MPLPAGCVSSAAPTPMRPVSRSVLVPFLFPVLLAGCSSSQAPGGKPELGSFGVDLTAMQPAVEPGDDFYSYVNGEWEKRTEMPADRSRLSSFGALDDLAKARTKAIIDEAAGDPAASGDRKKIADCFKAFMDVDTIEQRGLTPVQPELDAIAAIADPKSLATALGHTLRADVDLLNATDWDTDRLFGLWVSQHLEKPDVCAPYLVQGGLSLPDRDFYLEGGRMAEIRTQFEAHITKLLTLARVADAEAKAARILALETAIAKVHATSEVTNDVKRGANYWQRSEFAKKAPGLDWDAYFAAAGLGHQDEFIVWQPDAVIGISALVQSVPLDTWKEYMTFHALDRAASLLPNAFATESFGFYGTTLSGTPQQSDRWKRAVAAVNGALGFAVGKIYVARYFTAATKAHADLMVQNLLKAFDHRIATVEWMSEPTKKRARAKLAGMTVAMGYPDKWRDYTGLEISADDALGNAQRAGLFEYHRNLQKLGQKPDHGEWYMLPHEVNALNIPIENRLIFPAAILGAPFFDPNADDAVNYGAIGVVIGHEISHSYDSSGALFDEQGRLADWWTPQDFAAFEAEGNKLAAQFDTYKPFPDLAVNGKLTLGENIADVAGLATSIDAYHMSQVGKAAKVIDGFTPEQRLFMGFAQVWRSKSREKALRNQVLTNVHAPGQYRACTVRNQDAWYSAFDVVPGEKLYLAPAERVKIW